MTANTITTHPLLTPAPGWKGANARAEREIFGTFTAKPPGDGLPILVIIHSQHADPLIDLIPVDPKSPPITETSHIDIQITLATRSQPDENGFTENWIDEILSDQFLAVFADDEGNPSNQPTLSHSSGISHKHAWLGDTPYLSNEQRYSVFQKDIELALKCAFERLKNRRQRFELMGITTA